VYGEEHFTISFPFPHEFSGQKNVDAVVLIDFCEFGYLFYIDVNFSFISVENDEKNLSKEFF
jgi:hypothetical protein